MDRHAELVELLASYLEGKITLAELKASLQKIPAFEINTLLNQINSANDRDEVRIFVTDCLNGLMK